MTYRSHAILSGIISLAVGLGGFAYLRMVPPAEPAYNPQVYAAGNLEITDADRDGHADLVTFKDEPKVRGFVVPGMSGYIRTGDLFFNMQGTMRTLTPSEQKLASQVMYEGIGASELENQLRSRDQ
ncbi:MAG: hypothetical protein AABX04_02735 [Nanoarchaeota archaeon]